MEKSGRFGLPHFLCVRYLLPEFHRLLYGLFTGNQTITVSSLLICASAIFAIGLRVALSDYKEFQYFSQVSQLRERFQSRLREISSEEERTTLSPKEKELLSQVETQQVQRKVGKVLGELKELPEVFYAVAIKPEVLDYLAGLAAVERNQLREVIDALQTDPRPAHAHPVPLTEAYKKAADGSAGTSSEAPSNLLVVQSEPHEFIYLVNDERQRVDVIGIRAIPHEEVGDAS